MSEANSSGHGLNCCASQIAGMKLLRSILFRNMSLSSRSFCRLPLSFTNQVRLLTSYMRRLSIVFKGSDDWASSSDVANGVALQGQMANINRSPLALGLYLSQCTNSDHLGLETRTENIAFPYETPWRGYLWGSSICSVISSPAMDKLTSLVLDTGASVIFDPPMDRLKSSMLDTGAPYFD